MALFRKPLAYIILGFTASLCTCEESACSTDSVELLQSSKAITLESIEEPRVGNDATPVEGTKWHDAENVRHLQNFHATGYNRYPAIFTLLKDLVDKDTVGRPAKLLSFGCSQGAECQSLRSYFPHALIHGVDISQDMIAKAIASNSDPSISFFNDTALLSTESYDAVLAMGVLCHQGSSRGQFLSPQRFSQAVGIIDRLVRPGGYLVLYNMDHTFDVYPRHASFANVCQGSTISEVVDTADVLYARVTAASGSEFRVTGKQNTPAGELGMGLAVAMGVTGNENLDPTTRGMCSTQNKFCVESGWLPKKNAQEKQVQDYVADDESYGCKYPGPFFKKLVPIGTESN